MYKLGFHKKAAKSLKRITKGDRTYAEKIADAIRELARTPHSDGAKSLGLDMFRIRVGDYRVIYAVFVDAEYILIGKIVRRSESTYKDLDDLAKQARAQLAKIISDK